MFNAETYETGLRNAINAGKVNLLNTLIFERNRANVVTLPTVGAFSHDLSNAEAAASAQLAEQAAAAEQKIPIIEKIMGERGESTMSYVCKSCGQHRASRQCSMCYEPSEY